MDGGNSLKEELLVTQLLSKKEIMLPFLTKSNIERNIDILKEFCEKELNYTLAKNLSIKEYYFETINLLQDVPVPYSNDEMHITFFDLALQNKLLSLGMIDQSDLDNDQHIYSTEEQQFIRDNLNKAIELIRVLHPNLHAAINTLVGTFLILKKDLFGGGSVSNVLGLIWLNPQADWTIVDYAEAVYHEFIHQSIFLDDMVNCMFPNANDCATEEALVTSTILEMKRPLDRSFHAAGVSIGIMHLYFMLNDKIKSKQYLENLKLTLDEVNLKKKFLGEQGLLTLDLMRKFVDNPNFKDITYSLNN
jgi:hypothetical protein